MNFCYKNLITKIKFALKLKLKNKKIKKKKYLMYKLVQIYLYNEKNFKLKIDR